MNSKLTYIAAMLIFTPALAMAAPKNSANLELTQTVSVEGTQLAPGDYKLTWNGSGPNVTVNFAKGRDTVATATAKLVNTPNYEDAIETTTAADNTTVLQAIDLRNMTIQIENAAPAAGN